MLSACETQISDEQLAALARTGNDEAFALLVSRFSESLHRLSVKLGGASEEDDLAQEGLLGLLSAVRSYQSGGSASFSTYAHTCMRNRMISAIRASRGEPVLLLENEPQTPSAVNEDPAAVLVRIEELESLRTHLRSVLTELEYNVLMRYLGSYSYEEIAAELSVGRKTVDNALARLRRKLASAPFLSRL